VGGGGDILFVLFIYLFISGGGGVGDTYGGLFCLGFPDEIFV